MSSLWERIEEKRKTFVKKAGPSMRWLCAQIWKYHSTLVLIGFPLSICAKLEMSTLSTPMYHMHQQLSNKTGEQRYKSLIEQSLSSVPSFADLDREDDLSAAGSDGMDELTSDDEM